MKTQDYDSIGCYTGVEANGGNVMVHLTLTNDEFEAVYRQLLKYLMYTNDPVLEEALTKFHISLQQAVGDVNEVQDDIF